MIHEQNVDALYQKFVDVAAEIMRSDCSSLQMLFPERGEAGELVMLASRGLSPAAQAYWKRVDQNAGSTCAESLRTGDRTIAADYRNCTFALRRDDLASFMDAGIYAAQSTPLYSRTGQLLGMVTTHWKRPHTPTEHDLRLFDILARQAADLIERCLAEKALRESEERLRAFIATSSDATFRMNADWTQLRYLDGRDFVANTPGPSSDWMDTYLCPEDRPRLRARINEAVAAKAPFDFEHRIVRIDGTVGWVHSRAVPLLDDGDEIGEWFGAATDITRRRKRRTNRNRPCASRNARSTRFKRRSCRGRCLKESIFDSYRRKAAASRDGRGARRFRSRGDSRHPQPRAAISATRHLCVRDPRIHRSRVHVLDLRKCGSPAAVFGVLWAGVDEYSSKELCRF